MIQLLLGEHMVSEGIIKFLISIGALYADKNVIHASEPGIYPKKEEIPTQTANPSGDE